LWTFVIVEIHRFHAVGAHHLIEKQVAKTDRARADVRDHQIFSYAVRFDYDPFLIVLIKKTPACQRALQRRGAGYVVQRIEKEKP
jgi:hypothetical protein